MQTLSIIDINMAHDSKKKKKEVPIEFEEKIRRSLGWNPNDPGKKKNKKQVVKKK